MPYLNTPEEKAAEVERIRTLDWPLEPFLPMKRSVQKGRPDSGFLYREQLDRVYTVEIHTAVGIDDKVEPAGDVGGMTAFRYSPSLKKKLSKEEIIAKLATLPHEVHGDLAGIVEDGWVVD